MFLDISEIRKKCGLDSTYVRGRFLKDEGSVDSINRVDDDEVMRVTATVYGSRGSLYTCWFEVRKQEKKKSARIGKCYCDCPAHDNYGGFCKHLVAVALELNDQMEDESSDESETMESFIMNHYIHKGRSIWAEDKKYEQTSSELLNAMNSMVLAQRSRFCAVSANGDVILQPILHIDVDSESVEFKIGRNQMYVVKNVYELASNIRHQTNVSYGKNLEFNHAQTGFSKKSQMLVSMILENCKPEMNDGFFYVGKQPDKRYLTLSPKMLDEFLESYLGDEILVQSCTSGIVKNTAIIDGEPRIPVDISGSDNGSVKIKFPRLLVLEGVGRYYIYWSGNIYRCSKEYSEEMKDVLSMIAANRMRRERMEDNRYRAIFLKPIPQFVLGEKDIPSFVRTMLPLLLKNMEPDIYDVDFSQYQMEEGSYSVFFDRMGDDVVCRAEAAYGKHRHNLITPAAASEAYRDIRTEYEIRTIIEQYFPNRVMNGTAYFLSGDDDRLAALIEEGVEKISQLADVFASDEFKKIKVKNNINITTGLSIKGNLLDVSWNVEGMSRTELMDVLAAYKSRKKYFKLKSGDILNIHESGIESLADMYEDLNLTMTEIKDGMAEIPLYRALYLEHIMQENSGHIRALRDENFKVLINSLEKIRMRQYEIPNNLNAELRNYQIEGFEWANRLADMGFGGILADDMGLGKTLQMIAYMSYRCNGTHLVVCPASLVYNWGAEFERFAPYMKVGLVIGTANLRKQMIEKSSQYDVLVTSYDLLKRDIEHYENKEFECQVIDEAQYIKNPATQSSKAVKAIKSVVRFALTGTPIENRLSELWSIFEYLMPGYLYSYKKFKEKFEEKIMELEASDDAEKRALNRLHKMISPFVLRRLKSDVLSELPDKVEKVVYSRFEKQQDKLYKAVEKNIIDTLNEKSESQFNENKLQVLAELTKLRQICCAPELLYEDYEGESAKLSTCMELIESAVAGGHRILLFSQFTSMLAIIEKGLSERGIRTLTLTGSTSKVKRRQLVEDFQSGHGDVFLISLKAGGTGLNLTAADMVVHYDPWWNVAAQNQATDRAHRIGQQNKVTVIKLISKDTIEERILKLQEKKQSLADKIISEDNVSVGSLDREELMDLLGMYE